jgi:uncharacterized protein (TIGR00369 family)
MDDDLRRYMTEGVPYWRTLGLDLVAVSRDEAVFEGIYRDDLSQRGILHGGVVASIIDSVCACAAIAHTYPDAYATTINLQVAYMKAVSAGRIRAVGKCIRPGQRVLFCEAQVWNERGELVGSGSSQRPAQEAPPLQAGEEGAAADRQRSSASVSPEARS